MVISLYVLLLWSVVSVLGYPHLQKEIPNGDMVPHPCKPNYIWRGVGHKNELGGGERNPFGVAFEENNKKWTVELCRKDSDGDGKTNGEELGDPDCVWKPGDIAKYTYDLSHPGICDPINSTLCGNKPDYVNCDYKEFECEHIEGDTDVFNFTIRMPETQVPAKETTYMCVAFEFPTDQYTEYHLVAEEPVIDNENIMHHMVVTGICDVIGIPFEFNKPFPCGMGGSSSGRKFTCSDIIGTWTVGSAGNCNPPQTGILVGGDSGYKYGMIQYHWNNPRELTNYKDSSGMTFYATPKLRKYNAGIFSIGQLMLEIPPGLEHHEEYGGCSSVCTDEYMSGDITLFRVNNHMHYLGRAQFTTLASPGGITVDVANDKTFSYDSPVSHSYSEGILMRKGDELATTCVFDSTSRTEMTHFGESTAEEMCLSFFFFYPKENFKKRNCYKIRSIDDCVLDTGVVEGCNIRSFLNMSNPETARIISRVQRYCTPNECRQECLDYVRDIKTQPCFHGDVDKLMRRNARRQMSGSAAWYAALDSCNEELQKEQLEQENNGDTSSVSRAIQSFALMALTVLSYIYI